ncbi:MAG: AraC family transcriptional regulator [Novosphingobium sp.]
MSPPDRFDVVHARLLRFFPELVEELGGNADDLLAGAGLERAAIAGARPQVTYRQLFQLIDQTAETLRCADFGMRLAARQGSNVFGPLGQVMKHSRTFGEALAYVGTHAFAHSLAARIWQRRLPGEGGLFSSHDILVEGLTHRGQAIEQILLVGHLFAMELTGGRARVRRVHFRHQPLSPPKVYRRYFGCEVSFGQNEDGVLYSDHDLAAPIVAPDPEAYQTAIQFIEARFDRQRPPIHALVRGVVMQSLWTGECSNAHVAAELGLHARTLHRRLGDEGTSFQQIKDEVRRDVLRYYLGQTDLDLSTISEKLGFAEQSVLTRRCRRWFAATPTQVRQQHRTAA